MEDNYNYATGRLCGWIIRKDKRKACEEARDERVTEKRDFKLGKQNLKSGSTETDLTLAKAALTKASQPETNTQMSPLAITGIIVGSLIAITIMVVVIKKIKK